MNIESQVVSLELAKRLKDLGIKKDSQFYYANAKSIGEYVFENEIWMIAHLSQVTGKSEDWFSAFTVAELGEILFQLNKDNLENTGYLEITTEFVYRSVGDFYRLTNNLYEGIIDDLNEADARAKLLIMLLENGLMQNV